MAYYTRCHALGALGVVYDGRAHHPPQSSRHGYSCGEAKAADSLDRDALICSIAKVATGSAKERCGYGRDLSGEELNIFTARTSSPSRQPRVAP